MHKHSTTHAAQKSAAQGKAPKQTNRAGLARSIAAVLANPETPVALYNAMIDELNTLSSDYLSNIQSTPAYIEGCLEYHERSEAMRREGGRKQ
jgi:hypothetical protein